MVCDCHAIDGTARCLHCYDDLARRLADTEGVAAQYRQARDELRHDYWMLEDEARRTGPDGYDPIFCIQHLRKRLAEAEQRAEKAERERDEAIRKRDIREDQLREAQDLNAELRAALAVLIDHSALHDCESCVPLNNMARRALVTNGSAGRGQGVSDG